MKVLTFVSTAFALIALSACSESSHNSIVAPGYEGVKPQKPHYTKPPIVKPGFKKVQVPSYQKHISPSKKYSKMPINPKL